MAPDHAGADGTLGSVLVVGGGIGGMQAALDLAAAGYFVHLATAEPSIGGKMARLDKTFPTNDCAMCLLGPRMTDCQNHQNIQLHTVACVESLAGTPGHFSARIRKRARYVDINECTACGECEAVCPVEVPDAFNLGRSNRKAIYRLFPQSVPNKYLIEKRGTPPCRATCPSSCNAQGFVALIAGGKFAEAAEVVQRRVPFPGTVGRVCHHPCESECNRGDFDEPVSIAALKRAAGDFGWDDRPLTPVPDLTCAERVAVIGAGPAGLVAARDLRLLGYPVTLFEALPVAGGILRAGIPRYRLPADIVDREVAACLEGIDFRPNTRIGVDVTWADLRRDYQAIIIAIGLQKSGRLPIDGADAPGVVYGLDMLRETALGGRPEVGARVVVIGGGAVAMDGARTALRLGARKVVAACVEAPHEMPAHPWEVDEAKEEGIAIRTRWGPKRIVVKGGRVAGVEMRRVASAFDPDGRFNIRYVEGGEEFWPADTVIMCIGQAADSAFLPGDAGLKTVRGGMLPSDALTRATAIPGVFSCGDITGEPGSVVAAISAGHAAAVSAERYLNGQDLAAGREVEPYCKLKAPDGVKVVVKKRARARHLAPAAALSGFAEVNLGLTPEEASEEAKRCLDCGICSECLQCEKKCEKKAVHHDDKDEVLDVNVGAVVLAPGFDLHDANLEGEYGYGIYPNVLTSYEFERLLSSTGPTTGEVRRPSDGAHPQKVAFLQCVGSRDASCGAEYCSSICCLYVTKEAVVAKEHDKHIEPTVFYLDVRAFGKGFDRYVDTARDVYGVRYIRSLISAVREDPVTHSLAITYYTDKARHEEEFDLVVLATGARPPAAAKDLAAGLGFELNEYGFARTSEFTPVRTTRPGVYVAGAFRGPQDIPETVMTASAAAGEVGALLASGRGTEVRVKEYPPERDVADEEPRVGVFICRCGINIASVVDVAAVVEYALSLPGVAHAQETLYTCSQDSLKGIREVARDKGLNRVVVASCTIRTHQALFRENMREAGLNQFLFEMANIRDQCSWVHKDDPAGATTKAQDLVRMAVAKVKRHRALSLEAVPVTQRALVIGGGIAGMTAALLLAEQGVGTYLVEREPALGGNLRRLYRTLDGGDVQALLDGVTGRVAADRLVGTYLDTVIEDVSGHAGHFTATLSVGGGDGADGRRQEKIEFGATIVATGAGELTPAEYLYGQSERVVTGLELEEMLVSGPGRLGAMREVAFMQCVGSRQKDHDYCSRVCCAETVKNALELKKLNPRLRIYVLHRDMRTYGFMEGHYRRAREAGVVFIPFRDEEPPAVNDGRRWLEVAARDRASGLDLTLRPDLLVLAAGTIPAPGTKELASLLKLPTNEDGFFLETHIKLGPMDFPSQGVFLCGAAHGPKFISEAVYQAQGAVARAMGILSKPELMVGGTVARVDKEKCAACLTCVRVCPFTVPRITAEHVAAIAAVECQGCGTCAAECPGRAIELGFYEGDQLKAKIGALFPEAAGS